VDLFLQPCIPTCNGAEKASQINQGTEVKFLENLFIATVAGIVALALGLSAHMAFAVFAGTYVFSIVLDILFFVLKGVLYMRSKK